MLKAGDIITIVTKDNIEYKDVELLLDYYNDFDGYCDAELYIKTGIHDSEFKRIKTNNLKMISFL